MKGLLFVPVCAFLLFFCSGCSNPNESIQPDNTPPGSRDYVWTIDTLKTDEPLYITSMWGSSPEDVWAVGSSSWSATTIWHYNGRQWTYDSVYRQVAPTRVLGFSANEVWLVNTNSRIWKYDGSSWKQYGFYSVPKYGRCVFAGIYGKQPNDIYAFGYADHLSGNQNDSKAILIHYDGSKWSFVDIPIINTALYYLRIDEETNALVFQAMTVTEDHRFIYKILSWNGLEFKELSSGEACTVFDIDGKVYVTIGNRMYKYRRGSLELYLKRPTQEEFGTIWGARSEKDFFHCIHGGVEHYNGSDFQIIYKTDYDPFCGYIMEKDVYFAYKDMDVTGKTFMIHGKLKEKLKE